MNAITKNNPIRLRKSLLVALSTVMVLTALGLATPALAQDRYRRDDRRDWNEGRRWDQHMSWGEHERRAHIWHRVHRGPYPRVIYAPPPVVYYPPEPSSGLTFVFPLDFR